MYFFVHDLVGLATVRTNSRAVCNQIRLGQEQNRTLGSTCRRIHEEHGGTCYCAVSSRCAGAYALCVCKCTFVMAKNEMEILVHRSQNMSDTWLPRNPYPIRLGQGQDRTLGSAGRRIHGQHGGTCDCTVSAPCTHALFWWSPSLCLCCM